MFFLQKEFGIRLSGNKWGAAGPGTVVPGGPARRVGRAASPLANQLVARVWKGGIPAQPCAAIPLERLDGTMTKKQLTYTYC
jgi:hypothetical protein